MKPVFTPGPWEILVADPVVVISGNDSVPADDAFVAMTMPDSTTGRSIATERDYANARLIAALPELLAAVREFVSYGKCRQSNRVERDMLARRFAQLAEQYDPLLTRLGVSPRDLAQVDFDEISGITGEA